jgi:hypothetical protein
MVFGQAVAIVSMQRYQRQLASARHCAVSICGCGDDQSGPDPVITEPTGAPMLYKQKVTESAGRNVSSRMQSTLVNKRAPSMCSFPE